MLFGFCSIFHLPLEMSSTLHSAFFLPIVLFTSINENSCSKCQLSINLYRAVQPSPYGRNIPHFRPTKFMKFNSCLSVKLWSCRLPGFSEGLHSLHVAMASVSSVKSSVVSDDAVYIRR